jgi:hypothetical protein
MVPHEHGGRLQLLKLLYNFVWLRTITNKIAQEEKALMGRQISNDCLKGIEVGVYVGNHYDSQW